MRQALLTVIVSVCIAMSILYVPIGRAHSGGLDANGCHAGSQPYHCHRAPSEMEGNRLRCDLGSRSAECNTPSPATSSDPSSSNSSRAGTEAATSATNYLYLDCTEDRSTNDSAFSYIRVNPEKSLATLDRFYEWEDRPAVVDLDYYRVDPAFTISRSSLVLTTLFNKKEYQCELISAELMEETRMKLFLEKTSKQRI